jgi:Protein of unknown function (DUF1353)
MQPLALGIRVVPPLAPDVAQLYAEFGGPLSALSWTIPLEPHVTGFTNRLVAEWDDVGAGTFVTLEQPLGFRRWRGGIPPGHYDVFTVPPGFRCDGASIPRRLWSVPGIGHPLENGNVRAAVLHDFLLSLLRVSLARGVAFTGVSRKAADGLFYAALRADHKPLWAAATMWAGVRAAGIVKRGRA